MQGNVFRHFFLLVADGCDHVMCSVRNDILKSDVADPASLRVMQLLGRQGGVSQACGQDPPRQELRPKSQ